uniref:Uncharacterized protein n=1 Tax=Heterorhabditis bacteriophora TaxID=37862 RepID=A0A1I7WAL9_HETBA
MVIFAYDLEKPNYKKYILNKACLINFHLKYETTIAIIMVLTFSRFYLYFNKLLPCQIQSL